MKSKKYSRLIFFLNLLENEIESIFLKLMCFDKAFVKIFSTEFV